jgi:hypothetical protein
LESIRISFELAIRKYTESVGKSRAITQARQAGVKVSEDGHVTSWDGDPLLVLLKLIRSIAEDGQLNAIGSCLPLIDELERLSTETKGV